MVDQYPFEGYTDIFPTTETVPDWFGFGLKNFEHRSTPVKHVVLADGHRHAVIEVMHTEDNGYVEGQIMERLKGQEAEQPHLSIASSYSHWQAPMREARGHPPLWQHPESRPSRHHTPGGNWFGGRSGQQGRE